MNLLPSPPTNPLLAAGGAAGRAIGTDAGLDAVVAGFTVDGGMETGRPAVTGVEPAEYRLGVEGWTGVRAAGPAEYDLGATAGVEGR